MTAVRSPRNYENDPEWQAARAEYLDWIREDIDREPDAQFLGSLTALFRMRQIEKDFEAGARELAPVTLFELNPCTRCNGSGAEPPG